MNYLGLTINHTAVNHAEFSGESYFTFNETATDKLRDHYSDWLNTDCDDDTEDMWSVSDSMLDESLNHNRLLDMRCAETHCVDTFIMFICALVDGHKEAELEGCSVDVHSEHIIWLFHDLCHARYDASDISVEVEDYSEARAINASILMCIENDIAVPWQIINNSEKEYAQRFGTPLRLRDDCKEPQQTKQDITFKTLTDS